MSTYREAIHHARAGGTARRGTREIRFLTREEAEPIILERAPSRRVAHDESGPIIKRKAIVVETFADPAYKVERFGLFDVGATPPCEFAPTDEDVYVFENGEPKLDDNGDRILAGDWVCDGVDAPEPIAPDAVDEVLQETEPQGEVSADV